MKLLPVFSVATVWFAASAASAQFLIQTGPGNFEGDENILFNEPGLIQTGLTVQGISNNTGFTVDFIGLETLTTPAGGQARVAAQDGGFQSLTIDPNLATVGFRTLILNINATTSGMATVNVNGDLGGFSTLTFAVTGGGENFVRINTTGGEFISNVNFTTTIDTLDARQIRIGGLAPVPEPATMAAIGLGLVGLVARRRRKA